MKVYSNFRELLEEYKTVTHSDYDRNIRYQDKQMGGKVSERGNAGRFKQVKKPM